MNENSSEEKKMLAEIAADYDPKPFEVEDITLPNSLLALKESIAENTHDCWAKARKSQGWTYGPFRDDVRKKHPDLLPYSYLSEEEKEYDRASAINAIKVIIQLGYSIHKDKTD